MVYDVHKVGHLPGRCWKTFPDLQQKGQRGDGEEEGVTIQGFEIGAVDICVLVILVLKMCHY